jgi:hypothetical protein
MTYAKLFLVFCLWFAAGFCWGQAMAPHVQTKVMEKLAEKPVPQGPWVAMASALQTVDIAIKPIKRRPEKILPPRPPLKGTSL